MAETWIDTSDKMPAKGRIVLVYFQLFDAFMRLGSYQGDGAWIDIDGKHIPARVTRWQPVERPKEDK